LPDWLPGVLTAIIMAIPACWGLIQTRRKVVAETEGAIVAAYKSLVTDLRERLEVALEGNRIKDEENRGLREANSLLFEQKIHCESVVTQLTARLAMREGRLLYNANDLDDERGQDGSAE
jgi:hypothetical protein